MYKHGDSIKIQAATRDEIFDGIFLYGQVDEPGHPDHWRKFDAISDEILVAHPRLVIHYTIAASPELDDMFGTEIGTIELTAYPDQIR